MEQKRTPQRASINGTRNRLALRGQDPKYVYRIVNDIDDRVQSLMEAGYEIVTDNKLQVGDKRAGQATSSPGTPQTVSLGMGDKGVVMRIPRELFEERQAEKHREVKERESMLKNPSMNGADYGNVKLTRD